MTIEELQELLLQKDEMLNTLRNDFTALKEQLESREERVKELEQYNQKLFLRATATTKAEEPKEDFKSKLIGEYVNLLNDDEIKLLKEIEEDL